MVTNYISKVDFETEVTVTIMFYDDIVHEFGKIMQNKGHYQIW